MIRLGRAGAPGAPLPQPPYGFGGFFLPKSPPSPPTGLLWPPWPPGTNPFSWPLSWLFIIPFMSGMKDGFDVVPPTEIGIPPEPTPAAAQVSQQLEIKRIARAYRARARHRPERWDRQIDLIQARAIGSVAHV